MSVGVNTGRGTNAFGLSPGFKPAGTQLGTYTGKPGNQSSFM